MFDRVGRAAIVIPEGILFRTASKDDKKVRQWILDNCNIEAIISLPQGIFRPYTKNKTDIIILSKDKKGTKSIWFYDLTEDGFELNSDLRKPSDKNDIPDLLSKWTSKAESNKSWNISRDEIEKHGIDLMAKTYKPHKKYDSEFPQVPFSEIMKENKDSITLNDKKEYQRITIKLRGQGITLRDLIQGKKIKTKKQKLTKTNQFAVAEIDAKFGAFGIIPEGLEDSIVSSHYFLFDLDTEKVLPQYFDYLIRFAPYTEMIQPMVKGTTNYAAIRPKDILSLKLPLPSINIQKKIIYRVQKQEKIFQNFENILNELKEGFLDEIAFDAKNPKKLVTIIDVLKEKLQGANKNAFSEIEKGNSKLIRIIDIDIFGKINYEKLPATTASKSEIKRFQVMDGDLLIARSGSIGKCAVIENPEKGIIFASYLIRFRMEQTQIFPKYLMYYLLCNDGKTQLLERGTTTTHTNINAQRILTIQFPLLPLKEQKDIVNKIEKEIQFYEQIQEQNIRIKNTIKKIIMSLFS